MEFHVDDRLKRHRKIVLTIALDIELEEPVVEDAIVKDQRGTVADAC